MAPKMFRALISGHLRVLLPVLLLAATCSLWCQTTVATGSIQGMIVDPSGAVVPDAKITITDSDTGQVSHASSSSRGTYASGALIPGRYLIRVENPGFETLEMPVVVQVGVTTGATLSLRISKVKHVVQVLSSEVAVNTEQAIVQGVLTADEITNLPINGRKFLDLAQLEPGVQIQDGSIFDPTKIGFMGVSFGGRFGQTARIEVDGIGITDEISGSTTTEIPSSGIQEFQVSQSLLDLSNEPTSEGAVNLVTRTGTNQLHGELFDFFRDSSVAAALPGPRAPFQRHQFGARLGGPIMPNRLFFLVDVERTKQDLFAPVPLSDPFSTLSGGINAPFRETDVLGRLDWQFKKGGHFFYRFAYYQDLAASASGFQPFNNKNYTPAHVLGVDFSAAGLMHSVRFGYVFFRNDITDAVRGSSLPFANLAVSLNIGPLATGPNFLAPQASRQSNHQLKYDGGKVVGSHIVRFGVSYNLVRIGGFAKLSGITPNVFSDVGDFEKDFADNSCGTGIPCYPGGRREPRNYPVEFVIIGNGLGFATEKPAFGFPLGGLTDNRLGLYVGDTWKIKRNLTFSYGLRYLRDTGRTNSDLPPMEAVNDVLPGLGNRVRQPNTNFAPQVGIAWDPWRNGKTVLRGGAGFFYDNPILQALLADRVARLPKGGFLSFPLTCLPGQAVQVPFADGSRQTPPAGACGDAVGNLVPIGLAASRLAGFQDSFQSVAASVGANASNPDFLPNLIASGSPLGGAFSPDYRSPRSIQINAGVERELRPGTVISADYLRNVSLHFSISVDANHTGDASLLNVPAALAAISATDASFGCGKGTDAASIDCAIRKQAMIGDFAGNGLDSPGDLGVGACPASLGFECAFAGANPAVGESPFLFPTGRSVYNALQIRLRQEIRRPMPGLQHLSLRVSYALSRFVNPGGKSGPGDSNQDFAVTALDNLSPSRFSGPATLDRTHQFSFGGVADLPFSFRIGFISHFYTALPASLRVPNTRLGAGEIFRTDFTGDGTTADLLPGTRAGSFGREIKVGSLNSAITNYNNTVAGRPTPAGQALVTAGLFTEAQLVALGAVPRSVALAPNGQVGLDALRSFDLRVSWVRTLNHKITIEPSAAVFNLFNFANFDLPSSTLSGALNGAPGTVNGTTYQERVSNRVGVGTGVFGLGAPRVVEFGLRLSF